MRTKLVPAPPATFETVVDARRSVPLVPAGAEDCCARLLERVSDRLGLRARDEAHEWLTFMDALGVIVEAESGYRRPRGDLDRADLTAALHEQVFGVRELLSVLGGADEPLAADTAFERFSEHVPTWERHHHADWEREWCERVERLLDWLVLVDSAERVEGDYRVV